MNALSHLLAARIKATGPLSFAKFMEAALYGEGKRGPITERIQRVFFDATSGRDPRYGAWLRHVAVLPVSSY